MRSFLKADASLRADKRASVTVCQHSVPGAALSARRLGRERLLGAGPPSGRLPTLGGIRGLEGRALEGALAYVGTGVGTGVKMGVGRHQFRVGRGLEAGNSCAEPSATTDGAVPNASLDRFFDGGPSVRMWMAPELSRRSIAAANTFLRIP